MNKPEPDPSADYVFKTLELSQAQFTATREFSFRSFSEWGQSIHRIMLLSAAIGGVVVPVLGDRTQAPSQLLRDGTTWLFASVAIGIVIHWVGRWVVIGLLGVIQYDHQQQMKGLEDLYVASTADEIADARAKLSIKQRKTLGISALIATVIAECAFYGTFLRGAWLIVRGFTGGM